MNTKIIKGCEPKLYIDNVALDKMKEYIRQSSLEIGWLGTAEKVGNKKYMITDVFLFKQEVHSTTTEITPEGLNEFAMELMQQDNGMDIWNNMRVWGHSHVNMSTSPSGQDDKQMETFLENENNFFIRIIGNKKGDFKIDIYDYEVGVLYENMKFDVIYDEDVRIKIETITNQINILSAKLNELTMVSNDLVKEVELDIKEKVKKKEFKTWTNNNTNTWQDNWYDWSGYDTSNSKKKETKSEKKEKISDINQFFDTLSEREVFALMEHIEMGGTSQDMISDYDLGLYGSYELDELVEEYCDKFIVDYHDYLEGEIQ